MTRNDNGKSAAGITPAGFIGRGLAGLVAVAYLLIGSMVLVILLFGGLWEGFGRNEFVFMFLATLVYIYGTVIVALRVTFAPNLMLSLLLIVLMIPALVYFAMTTPDSSSAELRQAATTYAENEDPEAVAAARDRLLDHGRRAGSPPQVRELVAHLEEAETDEQRIHLIRLLGEISYQHESLLEYLRLLREETRDNPERQALYRAAHEAIHQINPYEPEVPETEPER